MLEIKVDLKIERELMALARRVPGAVDAGLKNIADATQKILILETQKIYRRPMARRKNGKAMWRRSGDLLASVKAPLKMTRAAVTLASDVSYAGRRNGLGVDWQPAKPALGIVRKNPFFDETRRRIEPKASALFAEGVERELNL